MPDTRTETPAERTLRRVTEERDELAKMLRVALVEKTAQVEAAMRTSASWETWGQEWKQRAEAGDALRATAERDAERFRRKLKVALEMLGAAGVSGATINAVMQEVEAKHEG